MAAGPMGPWNQLNAPNQPNLPRPCGPLAGGARPAAGCLAGTGLTLSVSPGLRR